MTEDMRQELLGQIAHRRASIDEWLRVNRPRSSRLSTVSIISSALAAVFVAGPALGGEQFTGGAADALSLDTGAPVWRFLCVLARGFHRSSSDGRVRWLEGAADQRE